MNIYDVVIIGGGMVGSAAACRFGLDGRRVAVIESALAPDYLDDSYIDLRVSAISRASEALLTQLGAWTAIDPQYRCAYRAMRVWDAAVPPQSADVLCFDSAETGSADLGHIVENRRVLQALHRRMGELSGVDLYAPTTAVAIDTATDLATICLEDGREIAARLVVAADGAASQTRVRAGIKTRGWAYEQKAVVTHIETEKPHLETAYQRFLPTGPVALLPLYDGRVSVVWSTTPDHAGELLQLDETTFNTRLSDATDRVLGQVRSSDRRAAFELQLLHAEHYVQPRLALVGDAAHAVHPLAGQGVNMGFSDVRTLCEAVRDTSDLGELAGLRRFERRAKSDNLGMMTALEAIHRLFGHDEPVTERLRSAGLSILNRMTPVKRMLIRRAMGARN